MRFVQWIYNCMKGWRYPAWMKPYIQTMNDIMLEIAKKAGQAYLSYLQALVIDAMSKNMTAKEKLQYVFNKAKEEGLKQGKILGDSEINLLIEHFVSLFKRGK